MKKLLLSLLFFNLLQAEHVVYENEQEKVYLLKSTDSDFLTEQFITNFLNELTEESTDEKPTDTACSLDPELSEALLEAEKTIALIPKEILAGIEKEKEEEKKVQKELKDLISLLTKEQKKQFVLYMIQKHELFYVDAYTFNKNTNTTELIGEACFYTENKDESIYVLDLIEINENYRFKGIGRAMITTAEQTLQPKEIFLDSVESAYGFYKKLGFSHIAETINNQFLDVNMKKTYR